MNKKFLLKGIMVALPAPLVLAVILLWITGSNLILGAALQPGESAVVHVVSFLGSAAGLKAYIVTFFVFFLSFFFFSPVQDDYDDEYSEEDNVSTEEGAENGVVKWFSVTKGFGFITRESGEDIFVHFRSINGSGRRSLRQGQNVAFDVVTGDKGLQADNVSVKEGQ